jgi:Skp family chaperone for outer membrane proteins
MVLSTRGILAIGLGLVGLCCLVVGPSLAQQDGGVRKAAGPGGSAAPATPAAPIPPIIGTVDLDAVFKGYEKFKVTNKEFQTAVLARQNELMKIKSEAEEEAQMLSKLTPGTADFKKHEDKVTELKARFAAGREQAQREFQARESENVATIYKEAQLMVMAIAQWRKINYVIRVNNSQPAGNDPNSVMAALQNTMVYFDPRNDITNDVIFNLNRRFKAVATPTAGAGNAAAQPVGGAQPAGNAARPDQN